ncbi:MAG: PBP1A family penicillin-binding protein [Myxococcales bacterium]|nr:PBP1A family penicillin-binding protein [Myxococcales bacterium]
MASIHQPYEPDTLPPPPTTPGRNLWWRLLAAGSLTVVTGVITALIGLWFLTQGLPQLRSLDDYHPPQTSVVYGSQGEVIGRFYSERRTVVPFKKIPQVMIDAVVSSEDADFFEHEGIDILGISRCIIKNILAGRKRCGGSTITQQTVKTFFLTPEKTYLRKLRELILAKRVEDILTKEDILFLYLNQIYFGHGAYGIQEASQVYFGKDVEDITVAEAALLAGLPQSPSRLDPYKHEERALKRRAYVLKRLFQQNKIDETTLETSLDTPITLIGHAKDPHINRRSYYITHVRKILSEHPEIGEDLLLTGGLAIHTGLAPNIQQASDNALKNGVKAIDKRQGWRGPLYHLEVSDMRSLREMLDKRRISASQKKALPTPMVWDLARLASAPNHLSPRQLAEKARLRQFEPGNTYGGLVVSVENAARRAVVALSSEVQVILPLTTALRWARAFNLTSKQARPRRPSDVLSVGDVVLVHATKPSPSAASNPTPTDENNSLAHKWLGVLEQKPLAQAAVVVIDPSTREVRAMSGGYGSGAGTFNRAIQARRQAGSTFKPIVYAAAFNTRKFTPVSECLDAPRVFYEPSAQRSWKPRNYSGTFDGAISLRRALTLSKNVCSVRLVDKIGVAPVLKMAAQLGIQSQLPRNFSLALGSGDVTPLEMVNAYATLADEGRFAEPIFVRSVVTPSGQSLLTHTATYTQAINPGVAYQVVSIMQSVVEEGTAKPVRALNRPVAGKTGTTNEARNAWFIGFTPNLVAGVWVGFDDNRPLGPSETGGRAAIPIWLKTMTHAVENIPAIDFVAPSNIVFALVDPESGKLAPPNHPNARTEPFLSGTEPTDFLDNGATNRGLGVEYEW